MELREAIKDELIKVAGRIDRIEDKNVDYQQDKQWKQLRQRQDALYKRLEGECEDEQQR